MNVPKRVYHYTSSCVAINHILPSRSIRIGSLGATNDPRETREWGFPIMMGRSDPNQSLDWNAILELNQLQEVANRIRFEEWWVLCTTQNDSDLKNSNLDALGLAYFKYGYAHPRMWASYGDGHKGICFEFDGAELHSAVLEVANPSDIFCGPVVYANEWDPPNRDRALAFQLDYKDISRKGEEDAIRDHIRSNYKSFFLEKSRDWETETEYRWLVHGTSGPFFVDISKALRSVIVGVDFQSFDGQTLWRLCADLGVGVEKMYWNNRIPTKQIWNEPAISSPTDSHSNESV